MVLYWCQVNTHCHPNSCHSCLLCTLTLQCPCGYLPSHQLSLSSFKTIGPTTALQLTSHRTQAFGIVWNHTAWIPGPIIGQQFPVPPPAHPLLPGADHTPVAPVGEADRIHRAHTTPQGNWDLPPPSAQFAAAPLVFLFTGHLHLFPGQHRSTRFHHH